MTNLYQWITDSNPVMPSPAQPPATLTPIQAPATIAGSMANPYKWTLPASPVITAPIAAGPQTAPQLVAQPAPTISTAAVLPNATHAVAYTQTMAATGGTGPYTWVASSLPVPLVMSAAGVITGTVTAAGGPYRFTITVTDSKGIKNFSTFQLTVV